MNILQKMSGKYACYWDGFKSSFATFCEEVDIPGVKEASNAGHALVRLAWIIFLSVGAALTAYFIYGNVKDYSQEPTATKVYPAKSTNYTMPPVYFGLVQTKRHIEGWKSMNLSDEGVEYIQSLDWQYETRLNESIYETGKNDFFEFVKNHNLSTWSSVYGKTGVDGRKHLKIQCSGCTAENYGTVRFVPFLPYSVSLLYEIPFKPASPSWVRKSDEDIGAWFSFLKNYSENYYLALGKRYNLIIPVDLFHIWPNFDYDIRVNAHRIKSVNNGECIDTDGEYGNDVTNEVAMMLYHPKLCADNCSDDVLKNCAKCRKVRRDRIRTEEESTEKLSYCSSLNHDFNCQFKSAAAKAITKCNQNCKPLCDQLIYEYSVVNVPSFDDRIQITIIPTYTDVGIMTFEEVPTYTLESAISNIGGQLGLWLGLSVVSLVQIVLFWINTCLSKSKRRFSTANREEGFQTYITKIACGMKQ